MPTTTSYYNLEIAINRHRGIQPSEIRKMPFYVLQLYYESVKEELKSKKKANDEQSKQSEKRGQKFRMPKMKTPRYR